MMTVGTELQIPKLADELVGRAEVKGFKFKLHIANSKAFLYEVDTGTEKHYEVFLRKTHRLFGHIQYPKSNSFGKWAWSFRTLRKAEEKFNSLL